MDKREARRRFEKRWRERQARLDVFHKREADVFSAIMWVNGHTELTMADVDEADAILSEERRAAFAAL